MAYAIKMFHWLFQLIEGSRTVMNDLPEDLRRDVGLDVPQPDWSRQKWSSAGL